MIIANQRKDDETYYQIDIEAVHGTITKSITKIKESEDRTIKYAPDTGYDSDYIEVDGNCVDIKKFPNTYSFETIQRNHTIKVVYKKQAAPIPNPKPDSDKPNHGDQIQTGDSVYRNEYLIGLFLSGISIAFLIRNRKLSNITSKRIRLGHVKEKQPESFSMKNQKMMEDTYTYMKVNGFYAVRIQTKHHLTDLFEQYKSDGFDGCGYDWCTLMIAFINGHEGLSSLWNEFDYEPSNDEFVVLSQNKEALMKLMEEWRKIYDDREAVKC